MSGEEYAKRIGYEKVVCSKCGQIRYVQAKQYRDGLPDTCIRCDKGQGF